MPRAAGAATARRLGKLIIECSMAAECGGFIEAQPCGMSLHLRSVFVIVTVLIHGATPCRDNFSLRRQYSRLQGSVMVNRSLPRRRVTRSPSLVWPNGQSRAAERWHPAFEGIADKTAAILATVDLVSSVGVAASMLQRLNQRCRA
jgi:hypothetical protein